LGVKHKETKKIRYKVIVLLLLLAAVLTGSMCTGMTAEAQETEAVIEEQAAEDAQPAKAEVISDAWLTEATFPRALKSAGQAAFDNCSSLKSVTPNEGLEKLPGYVFQNMAIESVVLPGSLNSISPLVFMNCSNLQSIGAAEGSQKYMSEDGVLFSKDKREPVLDPQGNVQSSFTVPDGVQVIGQYAFSDAGNLCSITLSDSVANLKKAH